MKRLVLVMSLAMLSATQAGWAHEGHNEAFGTRKAPATMPRKIVVDPLGQEAIGLQVQTVMPGSLDQTVPVTGMVQAADNRTFDLTPLIWQVHVSQGEAVRAGQVLATLYSPDVSRLLADLLQERNRIQAEIIDLRTRAQRDAAVQEQTVSLARQTYQREEALLKDGITARKDFLAAQSAYEAARVELEAIRRRASQQEAALKRQLGVSVAAAKSQLQALGVAAGTADHALDKGVITSLLPVTAPASAL